MADEIIDTQEVSPDVGNETDGPIEKETIEEEKVETKTLSPDEVVEYASEKARQKMQSWMGRRDSELINKVSELINERITKTQTEPGTTDAEKLFDNPSKWFDMELSKRTQKAQNYTQSFVTSAGQIMDSDPLFKDKEFGGEVIKEIQKEIHKLDGKLSPQVAAKMLVSDGIANVYRRRSMTKTNPLKGNAPANEIGTITSSSSASNKKPVMPKISKRAEEYAKKWGYKEEDLIKLFADK